MWQSLYNSFLKPNNEIWGLLFCSLHFCVYLEIFDNKKLLKPIKTKKKECEKYMEILIFSFTPLGFLVQSSLKPPALKRK